MLLLIIELASSMEDEEEDEDPNFNILRVWLANAYSQLLFVLGISSHKWKATSPKALPCTETHHTTYCSSASLVRGRGGEAKNKVKKESYAKSQIQLRYPGRRQVRSWSQTCSELEFGLSSSSIAAR